MSIRLLDAKVRYTNGALNSFDDDYNFDEKLNNINFRALDNLIKTEYNTNFETLDIKNSNFDEVGKNRYIGTQDNNDYKSVDKRLIHTNDNLLQRVISDDFSYLYVNTDIDFSKNYCVCDIYVHLESFDGEKSMDIPLCKCYWDGKYDWSLEVCN